MSFRRSLAPAVILSLLLSLFPGASGIPAAVASPSAGSCALTEGNWVCNASGFSLDFSAGKTPANVAFDQDDGSGGDSGDNLQLQTGQTATYENVFPSYTPPAGGGTINARVTASGVSGNTNPVVDGGGFGLGALDVAVNNSEVTLTIEFFNSADSTAVTFENMEVLVQDLDGGTQDEFAAFRGIKSYAVLGSGPEDTTNDPTNSASILRVDFDASARVAGDDSSGFGSAIGSENPTSVQEKEARIFYGAGDQTTGSGVYEKKSFVSVAFHSTSRISLTAGSSDGNGIIGFLFGDPSSQWTLDNSSEVSQGGPTAGPAPSLAYFNVGDGSFDVTFDRNSGQYSDTVAVPDVDPDTAGVQTTRTFTGSTTPLPLGTGMSATVSGATVPISSWNTKDDGTGVAYPVGGTFRTFENLTLYAHYASFTATLKAGGSGEADVTQTGAGPTSLQSNPFTRSGYRFTGWESAEGDTYADGATLNFNRTWELTAQWAEEFDLTFDANSGSGTMPAQTEIDAASIRTNSFTRSGYTFSGWNTAADGTGTAYAADASFPFTVDDTLYAQWAKSVPPIDATHDIWIEGDGSNPDSGSGTDLILKMGDVSTGPAFKRVALIRFDYDPSYVWTSAALDLVVSGNSKGSTDPDYGVIFKSFNVNIYGANDADWAESSTTYTSVSTTASDWKIVFTHPYSTPGATFLGNVSVPANSTSDSSPTLGETYSLSRPELVSFLNDDSDGKVTFFITRSDDSDQSNLQFASSENPTYDGPRLTVPGGSFSYSVAYDINGGTGTAPNQGAFVAGTPHTIAAPSSMTPPSGKAFAGWNSKADGSGTAYSVGSPYSTAASLTLYAQYTTSPVVTFVSNDGAAVSAYQTVTSGVATTLTSNSFTRSGYTFGGWNTAADGSGTTYSDGGIITISSSLTLHAQWTAQPSGSSGSSEVSSKASPSTTSVAPAPPVTARPTRLAQTGPNTDPVTRPVDRLGLVFDPDSASRATVGGAIVNLSKTPLGPSALSLAAGAFEFGVRLNEGSGAEVQTDTPSDSPELFVPRGDDAEVSGKGSYPGSFVQVWLPGQGNDSRELARIPVSSDGTFASDLSFAAGAMELPVPIGRQVLQVVGYGEQGNQTVVDMTINIGQGVPAPEPNRQVGALPDLNAGESLATSGGIPESVSLTGVPETGSVVVEGNEWVISVNADRDNGVVEEADGNLRVQLKPSSVGTASGSGFLPGTLATVWLFSEPTLMTTVTIDESGEFSSEFLVDARLIAPGEHTLQVQGVGADGYIKAANLGVLVEEPVELTTESASGLLWWVVGAFLLALVLLLFVLARRRRRDA